MFVYVVLKKIAMLKEGPCLNFSGAWCCFVQGNQLEVIEGSPGAGHEVAICRLCNGAAAHQPRLRVHSLRPAVPKCPIRSTLVHSL